MRAHPERIAWLVLLTSLALFVSLALGARAALRWFFDTATLEAPVFVEIVAGGTVLVQRVGADQPVGVVRGPFPLRNGDRVRTDGNSRALIAFPDFSNVELRPETALTILEARTGRFRKDVLTVRLRIESGRSRFNVALPLGVQRRFSVEAPTALLALGEGSYLVEFEREELLEVFAFHGGGRIQTARASFFLLGGERVFLLADGSPQGPVPIGKDLVINGDFSAGPGGFDFWIAGAVSEEAEPGEVRVVPSENGRRALHFLRRLGARVEERVVVQPLDQDMTDAQVLELAFDAKVAAADPELEIDPARRAPLTVRLKYRDATGREQVWSHSVVVGQDQQASGDVLPVASGAWFRFQKDLLQPDVGPRPVYVFDLSFAVAGRQYDTWVEQVSLVAR